MWYVSFQRYNPTLGEHMTFVGLTNYIQIFNDARLLSSLYTTLLYLIGAGSIEFCLGLLLALCVDSMGRGRSAVTQLILIPVLATPAAVGLSFALMFDQHSGIINKIITSLGGNPVWWGIPPLSQLTIIAADAWQWAPFMFLVLYAGLQSVPRASIEAAQMDGASPVQVLRHVTLPLMKPIITVALVLRLTDLFKIFDIVAVFRGARAETESFAFFLYTLNFRWFDQGYAAAVAIVAMFALSLIVSRLLASVKEEFVRA